MLKASTAIFTACECRFDSGSLHPKSNTTVECNGFGSSISIPARGWNIISTEIYGIINLKNVSNVRVTGCHLIGNGPIGSDPSHAPKLIYLETVNNVQIDHNELEQSGCEGIWEGGTQTTNTNIDVGDNYIHDMSLSSACGALPAIQMNADYAIVHDNRLKNVGTGIGFSAGHGSVTGNIVQNPGAGAPAIVSPCADVRSRRPAVCHTSVRRSTQRARESNSTDSTRIIKMAANTRGLSSTVRYLLTR